MGSRGLLGGCAESPKSSSRAGKGIAPATFDLCGRGAAKSYEKRLFGEICG